MKEFDVSISIGNSFGLQRSHDEVVEAVEIVAGNTNAPYVYDSFAFVATEMRDHLSTIPVEFEDAVLVGTSTLSCFTWDDDLVGGLLISLPWISESQMDAESFFESYQHKFGDNLVETFRDRPTFGSGEAVSITEEDIGLHELSVDTITTTENRNEKLTTFGFTSGETINILYLLSDGNVTSQEKFRSVFRQLDTLAVFESPQAGIDKRGTAWVPCSRVLDSSRFQSYIESEYQLSNGTHINLANLDSPQLYVDSELQFTYSGQLSQDCHIEIVGSRNANQIERQVRETTETLAPIDVGSLSAIKSGSIGQKWDGGEVFIGQTYVDWGCDCETNVCPTVVTIHTNGELTESVLEDIDSILQNVEGYEAFEVEVGDITIEASAY